MAVSTLVAPSGTMGRRQMNVVFGTVLLGMLLSALDQTVVSTALPTIVGDLGGAEHISWVVSSYLLADTIATVLAGKFGDLFGRKLVFQVSTAVFIIASAACGLAGGLPWLIGWRAVQGLGAGGLAVTATALIADVIPLRERGKYQGALGAVFGVTTVAGPLLGGLFTDHLSWRWAFYVNVPIGIVVIILASTTLPRLKSTSRPIIDYLGIVFVSLGASGLTLALSWGGTQYAWGSVTILAMFAGAVVALVLFVVVESRAVDPILPLRLFRQQVFSVSVVLAFIVGFAMLGAMTFLPTYLQYVKGISATGSGVADASARGRAAGDVVPVGDAGRADRPLQDLPGRRHPGDGDRAVSAVPDGCRHGIRDDGGLHARPRCGDRPVHAGVDDHRPEHRGLSRPRCGDVRGHVLPHPGQFLRCRDLRHHLRERPADPARLRRFASTTGVDPASISTPKRLARLSGGADRSHRRRLRPCHARRLPRRSAGRGRSVRVGPVPEGGSAERVVPGRRERRRRRVRHAGLRRQQPATAGRDRPADPDPWRRRAGPAAPRVGHRPRRRERLVCRRSAPARPVR